jgi:Tat protein translocase TatB subunit
VFGIGMPELVVILVVALVVLGPKRLPDLARSLGKAMAEFRRQSSEIMDEFQVQSVLEDEDRRAAAAPKARATETPAAASAAPATSKPGTGTA